MLSSLGQPPHQRIGDSPGDALPGVDGGGGIFVDDLVGDGGQVVPDERSRARQELVDQDAEGELIGAPVHRLAHDLLRRHVVGRPDVLSGSGQLRCFESRDAEVGDLGDAVVSQDDVGRLDVTVNHPAGVGVVQRLRQLAGEIHDLKGGEALVPGHELLNGGARHVLHRDVVDLRLGILIHVVDRHDGGVGELSCRPRLAVETLDEPLFVAFHVGTQGLEHQDPVDAGIPSLVDHPHGPLADLLENFESPQRLQGHPAEKAITGWSNLKETLHLPLNPDRLR